MAIDPLPRLTVYSRRGCHLCEDMIAGLRRLQMRNSLEFETVDIDVDPAVARRYGDKVPVLAYGDRELCQYYLEPAVITAFLAELR
jgi:glutaredoxin